jgi:hypothetical protein
MGDRILAHVTETNLSDREQDHTIQKPYVLHFMMDSDQLLLIPAPRLRADNY